MAGESTRNGTSESAKGKSSSRQRVVLEYVALAIVAIAVALLIQAFLVKPYRIPSESMQNTLLIGDRVLVDRISWRFSDPKRGDIVVFHAPVEASALIKRIIGMPGDTVSLSGGSVYINDQKLNEPYVRAVDGKPQLSDPFPNGLPWALQQPYKVPAGSYFLMGDNRTHSGDSRDFGPIARDKFVGRAFARYWPPGRIGGLK